MKNKNINQMSKEYQKQLRSVGKLAVLGVGLGLGIGVAKSLISKVK